MKRLRRAAIPRRLSQSKNEASENRAGSVSAIYASASPSEGPWDWRKLSSRMQNASRPAGASGFLMAFGHRAGKSPPFTKQRSQSSGCGYVNG